MIEMRPGRPEEIPAQKELWRKAFGDETAYIDHFYKSCIGSEDMMVLLEDGVLVSMLALLPHQVVLPDGDHASAAYIYALATDPDTRQRGHGRSLLHYADFYLREQGVDCVTTVPAEAGLFKFFATVGFEECFATRKLELLRGQLEAPQPGASIEPVSPVQYNTIRRRLLAKTLHADYGDALIAGQESVSRLYGGGLYRIEVDGVEGVAAVEYSQPERVAFKELLIPSEQMAQAVAQVAGLLGAEHYHVRTPAFWDGLPTSYIQPFAMVKWFKEGFRRAAGDHLGAYFGLAFD